MTTTITRFRPLGLALLAMIPLLSVGGTSAEAGWHRHRQVCRQPVRVVRGPAASTACPAASGAFSHAQADPLFSSAASGAYSAGVHGHSNAMSSAASTPLGSTAFSSAFSGGVHGSSSAFSSSFNMPGIHASFSNSMAIGPRGVSQGGSNSVSISSPPPPMPLNMAPPAALGWPQ